jgi:hypothetical protein
MQKKNKLYISTLVIFWIIVASFILMMSGMYLGVYLHFLVFFVGLPSTVVLSLLGIALIVLAARARFTKISKAFFILTGSAAAGMGISIVLHNLVFGVLIKLLGEGFWESASIGDEPVFFILATIICPLALLVGIIGSIILIARKKVLS